MELHPNIRYETTPIASDEEKLTDFEQKNEFPASNDAINYHIKTSANLPVADARSKVTDPSSRPAEHYCKRCGEPKVQSSGKFCLACQAAIDRYQKTVVPVTDPANQIDKASDRIEKFGSRAVLDAYHEKRERAPSSRINMIGGQPLKWWKS